MGMGPTGVRGPRAPIRQRRWILGKWMFFAGPEVGTYRIVCSSLLAGREHYIELAKAANSGMISLLTEQFKQDTSKMPTISYLTPISLWRRGLVAT